MDRAGVPLLLKRLLPVLVLLGTGAAACRNDPDTLVVANDALRTIKLSKYLTLYAYPVAAAQLDGAQPRLRAAGAELTCCVASSAPRPDDGSTRNDQELILEFTNLPADPVVEPAAAGGAVGTLGRTAATAEEPALVTYTASIPAGQSCDDGYRSTTGFVIRSAAGDRAGEVRFAVVGDLMGDTQLAYQIGEEVSARSPDFLILLGNLASGEDPESEIAEMAARFSQLPLPVYATVGYEDVNGGGDEAFLELFGPTSCDFQFRQIRFVLLDSADHTLAPAQYDWLERTLSQEAALSLFFTHTPPFDPVDLRDRGFASHREAARLVALLRDHSVAAIFAGGLLSYVATRLADIPTYLTGATGTEAFDAIGPHFLLVTADASTTPARVEVERIDLE